MRRYSVSGRTAATAATADHAICALWNPSSAVPIFLREIHFFKQAGGGIWPRLERITTRGTPGNTITPDIDNDLEDGLAPPSGALLDLAAYTVQPTRSPPPLRQWAYSSIAAAGTAGSGFLWIFEPLVKIKPGEGVAIVQLTALASPVMDATFVWEE